MFKLCRIAGMLGRVNVLLNYRIKGELIDLGHKDTIYKLYSITQLNLYGNNIVET